MGICSSRSKSNYYSNPRIAPSTNNQTSTNNQISISYQISALNKRLQEAGLKEGQAFDFEKEIQEIREIIKQSGTLRRSSPNNDQLISLFQNTIDKLISIVNLIGAESTDSNLKKCNMVIDVAKYFVEELFSNISSPILSKLYELFGKAHYKIGCIYAESPEANSDMPAIRQARRHLATHHLKEAITECRYEEAVPFLMDLQQAWNPKKPEDLTPSSQSSASEHKTPRTLIGGGTPIESGTPRGALIFTQQQQAPFTQEQVLQVHTSAAHSTTLKASKK